MNPRSPITSHRSWADFFQPTLDAASIMASLAIVRWVTGRPMEEATSAIGLIAVVLFLLISHLTGLNRRSDLGSADREMTTVAATWTLVVMVLAFIGFATGYSDQFSPAVMISSFLRSTILR